MTLKKSGRSSKAKGRTGQQEIRDRLLSEFPEFTDKDIRSTAMGQPGEDLLLSSTAFARLPISAEVKRRKSGLKTIYDWVDQAKSKKGNPVVFYRADRKPWLVTIELDYFMELLKK